MIPCNDFSAFPGDRATVILGETSIPCILEGYSIDISGCSLRLFVDDTLKYYNEEEFGVVK